MAISGETYSLAQLALPGFTSIFYCLFNHIEVALLFQPEDKASLVVLLRQARRLEDDAQQCEAHVVVRTSTERAGCSMQAAIATRLNAQFFECVCNVLRQVSNMARGKAVRESLVDPQGAQHLGHVRLT